MEYEARQQGQPRDGPGNQLQPARNSGTPPMPQQAQAANLELEGDMDAFDAQDHIRDTLKLQPQITASIQRAQMETEAYHTTGPEEPYEPEANAAGSKRDRRDARLTSDEGQPPPTKLRTAAPTAKRACNTEIRHIRAMIDQTLPDIPRILADRLITADDGISVGALLDYAPRLTTDFVRTLQRPTKPRARNRPAGPTGNNAPPDTQRSATVEVGTIEVQVVQAVSNLRNFYVTARIANDFSQTMWVARILLDGGATTNLINRDVVRRCGLKVLPHFPVNVKMASGAYLQVNEASRFTLNLENVQRDVNALIIDGNTTYSILLGRGYLKSVHAVDDFAADRITIKNNSKMDIMVYRESYRQGPNTFRERPLSRGRTQQWADCDPGIS